MANELKYGDVLWMASQERGETLLMVARPPIVCEYCGKAYFDWEPDEDGDFICECGNAVREFRPLPCKCGENDLVALVTMANSNFKFDLEGNVTPYDDGVNRVCVLCRKALEREIRERKIRVCGKEEADTRIRMLLWTRSDRYEPGQPPPKDLAEQLEYKEK